MAKEDPIERIERERAAKASSKKVQPAKIIAIVLGVVLLGVIIQDVTLYKDLSADKKDLQDRITALQSEYNNLSSDYDIINAQLDSSREEVAQLVEHIKKTEATNLKRLRQYERELGTLRTTMRSYIVQIDSLNAQNRKLTKDLRNSQAALAQSIKTNKELGAKVETLTSQVAVGAQIKARDIEVIAQNASGRSTDRSSRVVDLLVNLTLSENDLAAHGPLPVYVRVKDADGILVLDGDNATFQFEGQVIPASASRTVDYEGKEMEVGVYVNATTPFIKGMYTIDIYLQGRQVGSTELLLR